MNLSIVKCLITSLFSLFFLSGFGSIIDDAAQQRQRLDQMIADGYDYLRCLLAKRPWPDCTSLRFVPLGWKAGVGRPLDYYYGQQQHSLKRLSYCRIP